MHAILHADYIQNLLNSFNAYHFVKVYYQNDAYIF